MQDSRWGLIIIAGLGLWLWSKSKPAEAAVAPEIPAAPTPAATIVQKTQEAVTEAKVMASVNPITYMTDAPAVQSGEVAIEEAARAISNIKYTADAAVVARGLGYAPIATGEELRAMTPGQDKAYSYGVSEAEGNLMAEMTPGELVRYCQAHGI